MGNVDPTVFQRMILYLIYRTASFLKVSVEPLPEALDLILVIWETGQGPLITQGGSRSAALHFMRQEVEKCECKKHQMSELKTGELTCCLLKEHNKQYNSVL